MADARAAAGSLGVLGAVISTPGLSQLLGSTPLGSTPLGPIGWAQALTTAAATTVAAIAPRVVRALRSVLGDDHAGTQQHRVQLAQRRRQQRGQRTRQ